MKKLVYKNINKYSFVIDFHTLGIVTNVLPNVYSYLYHHVRSGAEHKKIVLKKGRVVYKSSPTLYKAQYGIGTLLGSLVEETAGDWLLSYRKGLNPINALKEFSGSKCMIHFDIKKYFDNIKFEHIVQTLQYFGFSAGAKLVARYCVLPNNRLQQGSAASPAVSNLVGMYLFDSKIMKYLESYEGISYVRYCDNIVIFSKDSVLSEEFYNEYKTVCNNILKEAGFNTHKWVKTSNNNPKRNMKWLGVVLNNLMRAETREYDSLRGLLFSLAKASDIKWALLKNGGRLIQNVGGISNRVKGDYYVINKFIHHLTGKVAYINNINNKQGLCCEKLLAVIKRRMSFRNPYIKDTEDLVRNLKTYKNQSESLEEFVSKVLN